MKKKKKMFYGRLFCRIFTVVFVSCIHFSASGEVLPDVHALDIPDPFLAEAYHQAAEKNVLAAVNPGVFPGYWSVCADGQGFGYGNTYPSLDGHQLADALLWLGQLETVKQNWDYVRQYLRSDGTLPIAIFPALVGQTQFADGVPLDPNGGLYKHWVPGNPLEALAAPTFIANTLVLFEYEQDVDWLAERIDAVNLAAEQLASLTTEEGRVRGAGFYVERPTRIDSDGVTQSHAVNAFLQTAAMNRVLGREEDAAKYTKLAETVRRFFVENFWQKDHFAEYFSPERGFISHHGLTDSDWGGVAFGLATPEQLAMLWPKLAREEGFYYGNMPAGIATKPETYEDWEFSHPDRHDLGAMGRVWYLMAQAQYCQNDAEGLLQGLLAVAREGEKNDFYWRERYHPDGKGGNVPAGPNTYCEYPANFVRIMHRFLFGIDLRLDGTIVIAPLVTDPFWEAGFGQQLDLPGRSLTYRFTRDGVTGTWRGEKPLRIGFRLNGAPQKSEVQVLVNDVQQSCEQENHLLWIVLPSNQINQENNQTNGENERLTFQIRRLEANN